MLWRLTRSGNFKECFIIEADSKDEAWEKYYLNDLEKEYIEKDTIDIELEPYD